MWPSLGFSCSKISSTLTTCPYFNNHEFTLLLQAVFSATLLCLLPFQLILEHFQYISLS